MANAMASKAKGGMFDVADFLMRHQRIPCLDGWRAISISFVIGSHVPHMSAFAADSEAYRGIIGLGEFGVDIFLVLSGFLITYLLLLEQRERNKISLRHFYIRRLLRIFPIYFAFLAVVWAITALSSLQISTGGWLRLLTFTANYPVAPHLPFSVGHLWSLAVEEQFYLIWPGLLLVTLRGRQSAIWTLLGISMFIVAGPLARVAGYLDIGGFVTSYHSFFTRCDSIAWGAMLAALCVFRGTWLDEQLEKYSSGILVSSILLMVGVLYCFHNYLLGPIVVPFGRTLIGASAAAIIIISIRNPHSLIFSWLNWAPVAFVGVLSYSLYIWQQLFVTKAELYGLETVPWFLSPELFLLPLFAVAYGMHMAVERPFLSMKNRMFKKVDDKKLFSDDAEPAGKAEDNTASFRSGDGL